MPGQQDNPKFTPRSNENQRETGGPRSDSGTDTQQERDRMSDGGRNQGRPQDDRDPNSPTRGTQQQPGQTQAGGQRDQEGDDGGDNDRDPQREMELEMETGASTRPDQGQDKGQNKGQHKGQSNTHGQQPRQT